MTVKKNNGFVAVDMVLAILGIMIFSGLIVSLMYNNALENLKIKRETLAVIYLTETLENIGIANYEDVTTENIQNFIPSDLKEKKYDMEITLSEDIELSSTQDEEIIKKVTATILYKVGNKDYELSMERTKIKE